MIGTWIVAVEMLQKMRPQEFLKPDTEGHGGERWKHIPVVYEDKNERREWMGSTVRELIVTGSSSTLGS